MKILDAFNLAAQLHARHIDKGGRPYIEHLTRVYLRVLEAGGSRDQQIAALLHDSMEDIPGVDGLVLRERGVPDSAIEIITMLTHLRGESYEEYIEMIATDVQAKLVKLADIADNMDAARMSRLDSERQARLKERYRKALEILGA